MEKQNKVFYAVRNGRQPGVYKTWEECEQQVKGISKAVYKKFSTEQQAQDFVNVGNPVPLDGTEQNTGGEQSSVNEKRNMKRKDVDAVYVLKAKRCRTANTEASSTDDSANEEV